MVSHKTKILSIELIPSNSFGNNLRSLLRGCTWDRLRKDCYEKAGHVCEICGQTGKQQGRKHNVECHEIWAYNDSERLQTLAGLQALCPLCHQCKHIGRSLSVGAGRPTVSHLATTNGMTLQETEDYINESLVEHTLRSHGDAWVLDLSFLLSNDALTEQDISDLPYDIEGVFIGRLGRITNGSEKYE